MATPMKVFDLKIGDELPVLVVGPFTLADFVRWAAYQENWLRMHYDKAYADRHAHLPNCLQSGHHRAALLARMITDWLGSEGRLRRFAVRHTAPVFLGDTVRCGGRVRGTSGTEDKRMLVELDIWAINQNAQVVSEGTAVTEVFASGNE